MLAMPKFYDLQQLARCHTEAEIEVALDELEVGKDLSTRIDYLHQFMGTTQRYCVGEPSDGFSLEQEYLFAKQQLLAINED